MKTDQQEAIERLRKWYIQHCDEGPAPSSFDMGAWSAREYLDLLSANVVAMASKDTYGGAGPGAPVRDAVALTRYTIRALEVEDGR